MTEATPAVSDSHQSKDASAPSRKPSYVSRQMLRRVARGIAIYIGDGDQLYVGMTKLARRVRVGKSTAYFAFKHLEAAGVLTVNHEGYNRKRHYRVDRALLSDIRRNVRQMSDTEGANVR